MTTTNDSKVIEYIKEMYHKESKQTLCCDSTISYYRANDEPYTWFIHNAMSFLFDYNSQVPFGIAHNGQNKINVYLKAILRTINHIVFDGVSESKYQSQQHNHLKTFLNILFNIEYSGKALDAMGLIAKRCAELYSPIDPPPLTKGDPLNLLDVENIKHSFTMDFYHKEDIFFRSDSDTCFVVEIKLTNRSTKETSTINLAFHQN